MDSWKPSEWFQEKLQSWQKDLQVWHMKHVEYKDPSKRAAAALTGISMSKSAGPPPGPPPGGVEAKARPGGAAAPSGVEPKSKPAEKAEVAKADGPVDIKDLVQQLVDEMEREDLDIFGIDDISELKESGGAPLFCNFTFEDWALLSLRFELHLLVHAVRKDGGSSRKEGIPTKELASCYTKYYKKNLDPRNYGSDSVEDVLKLVEDTAMVGMQSKIVEPMVTDDLVSNGIFVKLTEDDRRDRKRKLDAGEEVQLKFPRPNANPAPSPGAGGGMTVPPKGAGLTVPPKDAGVAGAGFNGFPAKAPPPGMPAVVKHKQPPPMVWPAGGMGAGAGGADGSPPGMGVSKSWAGAEASFAAFPPKASNGFGDGFGLGGKAAGMAGSGSVVPAKAGMDYNAGMAGNGSAVPQEKAFSKSSMPLMKGAPPAAPGLNTSKASGAPMQMPQPDMSTGSNGPQSSSNWNYGEATPQAAAKWGSSEQSPAKWNSKDWEASGWKDSDDSSGWKDSGWKDSSWKD